MCAVGLGHEQSQATIFTHEAPGSVVQAGSSSAALAPKELLKQVVAALADPDIGVAAEAELVLKTHALTDKGGSEPSLRLAARAKGWPVRQQPAFGLLNAGSCHSLKSACLKQPDLMAFAQIMM